MQSSPNGTVLALSSEVGVGAVGLSIARFVFARQDLQAICLPTISLASRPDLGKMAGHVIPANDLDAQLNALADDGWLAKLNGVMTGYFASADQVETAAVFLRKLRQENPTAVILVDPVLGDCDTGLYVSEEVAQAVRDLLLPLADVITPNLFEFSWLCGTDQVKFDELVSQTALLKVPHVVVTSAHIGVSTEMPSTRDASPFADQQNLIKTVHIHKGEMATFSSPFIAQMPKGTGDIFASHVLSRLVHGDEMKVAVYGSVEFLERIAERAQRSKTIEPSLLF
ncbi:pyridoxine/pyridoxal/pyridoxamine kinase [Hyphomicrobiales bacterium 4NK60-0047b]